MKMTWLHGTCQEDSYTVEGLLFRQLHQLNCRLLYAGGTSGSSRTLVPIKLGVTETSLQSRDNTKKGRNHGNGNSGSPTPMLELERAS